MENPTHVHIVDGDDSRRAKLARELYHSRFHAETYDSLGEFLQRPPRAGVILIGDDQHHDITEPFSILRERVGFLPVAIVSSFPSPRKIVEAMKCGAMDYLAWPCSGIELTEAVSRLCTDLEGKARIERKRLEARRAVEILSPREREVLRELAAGGANKDIAARLRISPRTVEIHRANLMSKLNAEWVADAVRIALYADREI